jgi:peptidoglycan/LPS O-acetylase OafA/YrhL
VTFTSNFSSAAIRLFRSCGGEAAAATPVTAVEEQLYLALPLLLWGLRFVRAARLVLLIPLGALTRHHSPVSG